MSVGIPLVVGVLAGRPGWGAVASLGGIAGMYGGDAPRRYRIRQVAVVGLALTVVVPLSSLCAALPWLSAAYVGTVAAVACLGCLALRVRPPREYLIILAALVATGVPADIGAAVRMCGLVAAGAVFGLGVTAAIGPRDRAQSIARRGWDAVADVLRAAGTADAPAARSRAVTSFVHIHDEVRQAGGTAADLRSLATAEIVLTTALSVSVDAQSPLDPNDWQPTLDSLREEKLNVANTSPHDVEVTEPHRNNLGEHLRTAVDTIALPAAARIGVAVAAGAATGHLLGVAHAYWVALTVAAVLQGNNLTLVFRRTWLRIAGTVAGVGLATALFASHPGTLTVACVAMLAQFLAEILLPVAYGIGVAFVTTVPLAMYQLAGSGTDMGTTIIARLLDTAIGAALALTLRLVLWPRATASRLPHLQARTLNVVTELFRARWIESTPAHPLRRRVRERLVELHTLTEDTLADQIRGSAERARQVTLAINELAILALGAPADRPSPPRAETEALLNHLDRIADSLRDGSPPQVATEPLSLPGYPRTSAATRLLASALD